MFIGISSVRLWTRNSLDCSNWGQKKLIYSWRPAKAKQVSTSKQVSRNVREAIRQICRSTGHSIHALSITCDLKMTVKMSSRRKSFPLSSAGIPNFLSFLWMACLKWKMHTAGVASGNIFFTALKSPISKSQVMDKAWIEWPVLRDLPEGFFVRFLKLALK